MAALTDITTWVPLKHPAVLVESARFFVGSRAPGATTESTRHRRFPAEFDPDKEVQMANASSDRRTQAASLSRWRIVCNPMYSSAPSPDSASWSESTVWWIDMTSVSYTHLRAHETPEHLVCRLLLEKKKKHTYFIESILSLIYNPCI
eukprot:TRINITY_DN22061_c0_g1_i1.p1 TRINITY_DN22061_c0_g1~~TRINITY_DN22061_c0_g1_i1.p1  ORF type:complete len:148 (+),score=19.83 TRINITY_DN22061_c0_g1_i1:460-903(+)